MKLAAITIILALLSLFDAPSGRPPIGPLERFDPKLYDLTFGVTLSTIQQINANDRQNFDLTKVPIVMPLIFLGTYSKLDSNSVKGQLWLNSKEQNPRLELKSALPHNTHLAVMTIDKFIGQSLRWQISYNAQVWSSRINDEKAAQIPWPKEWPKEVQDGLQPQKYIESKDPIFADAVQHVSGGKLKLVSPYLAAKDLIRYCINQIQVSGDGVDTGEFGIIRGIEVFGASYAANRKTGTPHDLVCVCVAVLRAANIPARPVIGVQENEKSGKNDFVSWAEFYLPDAGWIPFDPYVMRGKGIRTMDVKKPWPEFGTLKDLNDRIPLSYDFIPQATVESPRNPAVWGWDPSSPNYASCEQQITIGIVSRGKGVGDPK